MVAYREPEPPESYHCRIDWYAYDGVEKAYERAMLAKSNVSHRGAEFVWVEFSRG